MFVAAFLLYKELVEYEICEISNLFAFRFGESVASKLL
jgi:hypothetical protein